jgi:hypothetical protein
MKTSYFTCVFFVFRVWPQGASYPFWLVPTMTIAIVLGTGYPAGPVQFVTVSSSTKSTHGQSKQGTSVHEGVQRGVGKSFAPGTRQLLYPLVSTPVAHFNHLISVSFDAKDVDLEVTTNALLLWFYCPTSLIVVWILGV